MVDNVNTDLTTTLYERYKNNTLTTEEKQRIDSFFSQHQLTESQKDALVKEVGDILVELPTASVDYRSSTSQELETRIEEILSIDADETFMLNLSSLITSLETIILDETTLSSRDAMLLISLLMLLVCITRMESSNERMYDQRDFLEKAQKKVIKKLEELVDTKLIFACVNIGITCAKAANQAHGAYSLSKINSSSSTGSTGTGAGSQSVQRNTSAVEIQNDMKASEANHAVGDTSADLFGQILAAIQEKVVGDMEVAKQKLDNDVEMERIILDDFKNDPQALWQIVQDMLSKWEKIIVDILSTTFHKIENGYV